MSDTADADIDVITNEPEGEGTDTDVVTNAQAPDNTGEEGTDSPEEQAARMGWKPEEDYKGPDGKWIDAQSFLDNTENDPIQLRRSLKTIERNMQKQEKTMTALVEHQDRVVETERQKAIDETNATNEAALMQAVEDGDTEAAAKIYNTKPEPTEDTDPKVVAWRKANPYMDNDPIMSERANQYADLCANQGDDVDVVLTKTDTYMRKHFPNEFPEAKRAPNQVNGGNRNGVITKQQVTPYTYEALNQESKTACDRAVKGYVAAKGWDEATCRATWMEYATEDMFV